MPTSVLLAVLVAAGLLALAPALVRRYDATERLVAERASSTARVLSRQRRRRTVPGRTPVNPPRFMTRAEASDGVSRGTAASRDSNTDERDESAPSDPAPPRPQRRPRPRIPRPRDPAEMRRWRQARRRRVFGTLVMLVLTQAAGVALVGPGFVVGLSFAIVMLFWYVLLLRSWVVAEQRARARQRMLARQAAARRAAEARRLAEKRRRMAEARRHAQELARRRAEERARIRAELAAGSEDVFGHPVPGVRGRSYQARAG